jgi:plasmid stabilization system protein ParE
MPLSVVRSILEKTRALSDFPYLGQILPEFDDETIREVYAYSYRVVYRIEVDEITIAAVINSKRLMELAVKP